MDEQPRQAPGWIYQIQVEGHLNLTWSAWFEELTLTHEVDGSTIVTGNIVDQATLHGVLNKVRDLGLTLISVQRIKLILSSAII
jgi:hypothetical protein